MTKNKAMPLLTTIFPLAQLVEIPKSLTDKMYMFNVALVSENKNNIMYYTCLWACNPWLLIILDPGPIKIIVIHSS